MLFQTWNWYRENYTIKSTNNAVKFFKYNTVISILMNHVHYYIIDKMT